MKDIVLPKILQPFMCKDLIRLGKDHDGGYLVNKLDILNSTRLFSFGIGDDISFEAAFSDLNSCPIDAFDGTISKVDSFFEGTNRFHSSNIGLKYTRPADLFSAEDTNVFIKCDIEGAEYEILNDLIIHSSKISGLVIEFHDVYQYPLFNLLSNFIAKTSLKLIHTHLNNHSYIETPSGYLPGCIELTFTASNNIMLEEPILPHVLDMPNTPLRDEFRILF
jgi:hypothetical protein